VLPNIKQVFLKVRQDEKGGTNKNYYSMPYAYIHTQASTHVHAQTHTHRHRHTYTHADTHTCTHTHTQTHTHRHMHIDTHTYTNEHTRTHKCMHIHTHNIFIYIHVDKLVDLLRAHSGAQHKTMVFCNTVRSCTWAANHLVVNGIPVAKYHGGIHPVV